MLVKVVELQNNRIFHMFSHISSKLPPYKYPPPFPSITATTNPYKANHHNHKKNHTEPNYIHFHGFSRLDCSIVGCFIDTAGSASRRANCRQPLHCLHAYLLHPLPELHHKQQPQWGLSLCRLLQHYEICRGKWRWLPLLHCFRWCSLSPSDQQESHPLAPPGLPDSRCVHPMQRFLQTC